MKKMKYLAFALLTTLLSVVTVNAKLMTAKELGEASLKYAKDARFIFVIGKYAYTSTYDKFNIQDVMLASSDSIELDKKGNMKDLVSTMTIYRIDRTYDKNYKPTGWSIGTNEIGNGKDLGTTSNQKKIDIRYIDYNPISEDTTATISYNLDDTKYSDYKKVLEEKLKFKQEEAYGDKLELVNGKLTGLLLKNNKITLSTEDQAKYKGAEYYFAYILEVPNATNKTTIKTDSLFGEGTISYSEFDVTGSGKTPGVVVLVPVSYEKWQSKKKITITIDLDGTESEYGPTTQTIDLSGLKFQTDSTTKIGLGKDKATQADKDALKGWGYDQNANKDLKLESNDKELTATLSGKLVEQVLNANIYGADKEVGYYFDFTFDLPDKLDTSKVLIEALNSTDLNATDNVRKTFVESEFDETGNLTILSRFEPTASCPAENNNCKLYFKIDLDGDGKEYLPVVYTIDYSKVTFEKSSIFTVAGLTDGNKFTEENGWYDTTDGYSVEVKIDEKDAKKYNVTGVLPIIDEEWEDEKFSSDEELYYLGLLLNLTNAPEGFNNTGSKMTVKFLHGDDTQFITEEDFDREKEIYVLKALAETSEAKEFTITVDLDGDEEEYAPYTVTIDWSGLKLQTASTSTISDENIHKTTQEELTKWGYKAETNQNVSFTTDGKTTKVKGKLVEQKLSAEAFGTDKEDGYYFTFTFVTPEGVDGNKVVIERLKDADGSEKGKTFQGDDIDADGNLTILYRFDVNTPNCSGGDASNCKLYYRVDLDGEEKAYLPTTYEIDYSELNFEKTSLFTVTGMDKDKASVFTETGWYNEEAGYKVEVKQDTDNPNKYSISGLLPILDESDWEKEEDDLPFDADGGTYYYLGLGLQLSNPPKDFDKDTASKNVKILFDHEVSELNDKFKDIIGEDFSNSSMIYILKALKATNQTGDPLTDDEKNFTITVDLDGAGEEYAPYTVTIDYSGLKFQSDSTSGSDYETVSKDAIDEEDKNELEEEYGFNFDLDNITYKTEESEESGTYHTGLTGTIKQQKLNEAAGFGDDEGYYVPVKITVPEEIFKDEDYKDKWTIYLKDGSGAYVEKNRTDNHYEDGYIIVLFKMKDRNSQDIHYKIDYDGSEGKDFLLSEEITIDTEFTYQTENEITFEYFDEKTGTKISKTEKVYESETIDSSIAPTLDEYSYHTFDYWYEEGHSTEQFAFGTESTDADENIKLKAHWTIDVDKFMDDVIADLADPKSLNSQDFSTHFEVTKNESTITFNVINSSTKLEEMDNTSIPGTIAYLLNRGEIKDITLKLGDKQVVFTKDGSDFTPSPVATISNLPEEATTLKAEIQKGAKALYSDVLSSESLDNMTLVNLAHGANSSFTLSVGALDETVKLANADKKEYTFKFESDLYDVTSEETLNQALTSETAKTISITKAFNVTTPVDITRDVLINGENQTLTSTISDNKPIFNIKSSGVTIENVTLADAKPVAITVESGEATIKNTTITGSELQAGIEVKAGAKLNVENLTYDSEKYENPAVRADKTNATVNLTDTTGSKASATTKENITVNNDGDDSKSVDSEYNFYNYYRNPNNSKIYETKIYNFQAGYRLTYIKYNHHGETLKAPTGDKVKFTNFSYDGENYELIGYTKDSSRVLTSEKQLPEGAIAKENLTITEDNQHYWGVYNLTLQENVRKVDSEEAFKKAFEEIEQGTEIKTIYITKGMEIDYTSEDSLTINKNISIIGPKSSDGKVNLKAKKIIIEPTAEDVFINRVNLKIEAQENQTELIEAKGKKLTLWQGGLENSGSKVDYGINYSNENAIVDIRYMGIDSTGFKADNITKSYIYVSGKLAAGSDLYLNTFAKAETDTDDKSAIIIKGFAEDAIIEEDDEDGEPDIRFMNNTVKTNYAMRLEADVSDQKADIKYGKGLIGVEWNDEHKNFKGIGIFANPEDVPVKYINTKTQEVEEKAPEGVEGISFKANVEMES